MWYTCINFHDNLGVFITAANISGVFEASITTVLAPVVVHTDAIQDASIAGLLHHQNIIWR